MKYSVICMPAGHDDNSSARNQYWIQKEPCEPGYGCHVVASNQRFTAAREYAIYRYKEAKEDIDRAISELKKLRARG